MVNGEMFGVTNGVITTLSILTGLHATNVDKAGIVGTLLAMIIADPLSDAYSIYISEKQNNPSKAYMIGLKAFGSQFILQFLFLVIILLFSKIKSGIKYSYIFGFAIVIIYGIINKISLNELLFNIVAILCLVFITYVSDLLVYKYYKE